MPNPRNQNANKESGFPAADTGNASNPAPNEEDTKKVQHDQLLDEKAETYIREAGSIEDLPDARDQRDMEKTLNRENE